MASFEEQLASLEQVVERLERGELTLEDSVSLFEEGARLSAACKKFLDDAEGRIQVVAERGKRTVVTDLEIEDLDAEEDIEEDEDGE